MDSFIDIARRENRRLLYLAGMASDIYCTSATLYHNLESLLVLLLRERGYRRIVFYSASSKLHWMDTQTARLCDPSPQPRQPGGGSSAATASDLRAGPLKGRARPRPASAASSSIPPSAPSAPETTRWHYGAMTDAEVVRTLQAWLSDPEAPTALVVRDAEDMLKHFENNARRTMNELFRVLNQSGSTGLCILVFQRHISATMFQKSEDDWINLVAPMLTRDQNLSAAVFFIGPPDETEIAHALTAERLKVAAAFNPVELQEHAARLARQARFAYAENNAQVGTVGGLEYLRTHQFQLEKMERPAKSTESPPLSAWERLNAMVGMEPVVKTLEGIIALARKKRRQSAKPPKTANEQIAPVIRLTVRPPLPDGEDSLHLALLGNPGTGKTHVARLIAEIYREKGILETGHLVEVTRKDLVAGYVGQTAINTGAVIERAMGGVLFIDEAYQLNDKGDQHKYSSKSYFVF